MEVIKIVQGNASDAIPVVGSIYKKVYEGLHFTANQALTLAAASAMNVLITAPATGQYHFISEVITDAVATITFSKAPNATATGSTAIVSYNNNENSANTSTLVHTYQGTYTSSGTVLETYLMAASGGNGTNTITIGGNSPSKVEWVIAPSSTHLIRIVAGSATCQTVVKMFYYREE
jgi:hypothetical protein